jgi:putative PIG3 family NAD(P)H quinone oxidoreductase
MKAVWISEFGGPEKLEVREVSDPPEPFAGEVMVRVRAAGLNRADLLQRRGLYPPPAGYSPNIPGLEFAGEIQAIGPDVREFAIGDRVFGITAGEAQAELVKVDASLLAPVPDDVDDVQAAAVPEAFITAHDALVTQGNLASGETVLIHAVASGVGLAALQIARAGGANVIGTSRSKEKLDRCADYGLETALVPDNGTFSQAVLDATAGRGAHLILDLVGGAYFSEDLACIAHRGRVMLVGLTAGARAEIDLGAILRNRVTIIGTVLRSRTLKEKAEAVAAFEADVVPLLASGDVRPVVDRVFPAECVREAHSYLESNESFGKVVLTF